MLAYERKNQIKKIMLNEHSISVNYLATYFNVSEETIRRDLETLQEEGIVIRTHGGATLNKKITEDLPYRTRNVQNTKAKQSIAKKLLPLIEDGFSIMVDTSSTVYEAIKMLNLDDKKLTVITNSAEVLIHHSNCDVSVISTGGTLRSDSLSLIGPIALNTVSKYNVDVAVFSCKAMSKTKGIMESNDPESEIKKAMQSQARINVLLIDHTKFDEMALISLFPFSSIDYLITDVEPSNAWKKILKDNNIELMY